MSKKKAFSEGPWYAGGLSFECQRCGGCCSGPHGILECTEQEAKAMAAELGLTLVEFSRQALIHWHGVTFIKECPYGDKFDCVLLKRSKEAGEPATGCLVRSSRPSQCRTWPFWPENIRSPRDWARAGRRCPGIDKGPLHSLEEIQAAAAEQEFSNQEPPVEKCLGHRMDIQKS